MVAGGLLHQGNLPNIRMDGPWRRDPPAQWIDLDPSLQPKSQHDHPLLHTTQQSLTDGDGGFSRLSQELTRPPPFPSRSLRQDTPPDLEWNDPMLRPPSFSYQRPGQEEPSLNDQDPPKPSLARPAFKEDPALARAQRRNCERIRRANQADENILGKHLPSNPNLFFPVYFLGPDDILSPPQEWVKDLQLLCSTPVKVPDSPGLLFSTDPKSVEWNTTLLARHEFNVANLLASQLSTTVGHGSEFRPRDHLTRVLRGHPMLPYLLHLFKNGMQYHYVRELTEPQRKIEVEAQVSRGNHKSANNRLDQVTRLLQKDVSHGFCIPFSPRCVPQVKGGMVQPIGIALQFGLEANGSRVQKERLTHDLSYSITAEDASVNSRLDLGQYPEMTYGWCLPRLLHFIVGLRVEHPNTPIYISKFDYSDAYRRISHHGDAAAQTILVASGVAYLMLRLAFGGSGNPPCFCAFSETLTDLANEISCSNFRPQDFHLPTVRAGHLEPRRYPVPDQPFGQGIPTAVQVPTTLDSRKDCFIDDIINVFLGTPTNLEREGYTVPLAVHLLSRPHAGEDQEPIRRRPLLGPDKLDAEGRPSEIQICLGWGVDTRRLQVFLPDDKYKAWINDWPP